MIVLTNPKYFCSLRTNNKFWYSTALYLKRTLHQEQKPLLRGKILGRTKHYPPAIKEWKDSAFFYNKNYMKLLPVKYNMTDKFVKGYFNITGLKEAARSKRMRSKIVRFTTKKLFVSKPEIKHTNDKTTLTIYIFNREKQFYVRKLFFYKRKSSLYNRWLLNSLSKKVKISTIKNKRKVLFKQKTLLKRRTKFKSKMKKFLPYYGIKLNNQLDFLRYKLLSLSKKFIYIDKYLMFLFISNLLSMFNIKIFNPFLFKTQDKKDVFIKDTLNNIPDLLFWLDTKANKLNILKKENINSERLEQITKEVMDNKDINYNKDQGLLNSYLWQFIENNYIDSGSLRNKDMNFLYRLFMFDKSKEIISTYLSKEAKLFFNHGKLQINKMKYTNLLFFLKKFVSRIYNKTAFLNIVNLKYLHLNSDIFTQAVALKLRKKQAFLKVLRKSLKLVKVPFDYFYRRKVNLNDLLDLNRSKSLNLYKLKVENIHQLTFNDKINNLLYKIFPIRGNMVHKNSEKLNRISQYKAKNSLSVKNKITSVLDSIKFKWVSGLRLEGAGRLTRRNTASRSTFKLMYKGNLKNKQYYVEHGLLKTMPTVMLGNNSKVNTQYTLTKSKRRIGSFGIKSWISSY